MAKNKKFKLTKDELFELCYSFYKDGDLDSQKNVATLGSFKVEWDFKKKELKKFTK